MPWGRKFRLKLGTEPKLNLAGFTRLVGRLTCVWRQAEVPSDSSVQRGFSTNSLPQDIMKGWGLEVEGRV